MKRFLTPSLLVFFVFSAWLGSYFVIKWSFREEDWGTIGDMFGAINALFSGFAFVGVIFAIRLQSEELGLQREELSLTRAELKRAADASQKSEQALSKQAEALLIASRLDALKYRIEVYDLQISDQWREFETKGRDSVYERKWRQLSEERNSLWLKLDALLKEAFGGRAE